MVSSASTRDDSQERKSFLDKPNSSKTAKSASGGASEKSNKTEKSEKKSEKASEKASEKQTDKSSKTAASAASAKSVKSEKTLKPSEHSAASIQSVGRRGPKMSDGTEFDSGPYGYIFSFIYLAVLWGLAIILAIVLVYWNYSRLDPQYPVYFGEGSFIGSVPKVTFDPNPRRFLEEGTKNVMEWNIYDFKSYVNFLIRYKQVLKKYSSNNDQKNKTVELCRNSTMTKEKACKFDRLSGFGDCALTQENLEHGFGFSKGQPCIMLKLNKLVGWAPKLKEEKNKTKCAAGDMCCGAGIQFECTSKHKNIKFEFFPKNGIPTCYFPYANQIGYEQPFQMVKLTNLTFNEETTIECYPTDPSLRHVYSEKLNEARFHILMRRDSVKEGE